MLYTFCNSLGLQSVAAFNARNKCLTAKLLQQGYRYQKIRKTFSKFYPRHYELISRFNVRLKTFYVRAFRNHNFMISWFSNLRNLWKECFFYFFQYIRIITRYRRTGYDLNVLRQSACLVLNPIMVDKYATFFNCTPVGRASDSMTAST